MPPFVHPMFWHLASFPIAFPPPLLAPQSNQPTLLSIFPHPAAAAAGLLPFPKEHGQTLRRWLAGWPANSASATGFPRPAQLPSRLWQASLNYLSSPVSLAHSASLPPPTVPTLPAMPCPMSPPLTHFPFPSIVPFLPAPPPLSCPIVGAK